MRQICDNVEPPYYAIRLISERVLCRVPKGKAQAAVKRLPTFRAGGLGVSAGKKREDAS